MIKIYIIYAIFLFHIGCTGKQNKDLVENTDQTDPNPIDEKDPIDEVDDTQTCLDKKNLFLHLHIFNNKLFSFNAGLKTQSILENKDVNSVLNYFNKCNQPIINSYNNGDKAE